MDELSARGVVFEHYDQPGLTTDQHGVFETGRFRAPWFKDPDGNTMALTELAGQNRRDCDSVRRKPPAWPALGWLGYGADWAGLVR